MPSRCAAGEEHAAYFDAAFANPEIHRYLEAKHFQYVIRLPANDVLHREIEHLMMRPVGRPPRAPIVIRFYNHRGTAEQWIKEGKNAVKWTQLSCHDFIDNYGRS